MIGGSAVVLLAAVAGVAVVLAAGELVRSVPLLYRTVEEAIDPLSRLGREGRPPTDLERRNLGGLIGLGLGGFVATLVGLGPAALAAALGPALAAWLIGRRHRSYRRWIEDQIPALATALADALAAGGTPRRALADAAAGIDGPMRAELARVGADLDLGRPMREALGGFAERIDSAAVESLVKAILSQERTGGDLAALLRRHAGAAEERRRSEAEARAATAQARMTGGMVVGMPLVAALLVEIGSPGFISGITSQPLALMLVVTAIVLQALGYLLIRRMGEIRR